MSDLCAKCATKKRMKPGPLCVECQREEQLEAANYNLKQYPELNDFVTQWVPALKEGTHRDTFVMQLCLVFSGIFSDLKHKKSEPSIKSKIEFEATGLQLLQALVPNLEEDTLLALRYLYYVKAYSVIDDSRYDQAERAFMARPDIEDSPLMNPGSDCKDDYPERVIALAFYLMTLNEERRKACAPA